MQLFKHLYSCLLGLLLYRQEAQSIALRVCLFMLTGQDIQDTNISELMKETDVVREDGGGSGGGETTSTLVSVLHRCTKSNVATLFCRHYFDVLLEW
jgi:hypothetical protein